MADVLVIGGGMAGAMAALRARSLGASVLIARRALGATALSSGAIDVAADLIAPPGKLPAQVVDPIEAAQTISMTRPFHPYAVVGVRRLNESLQFAAKALGELLVPPLARNALWLTPLGTVKPAAMGQRSLLAANVVTLPREIAIVEFAVNPILDARLIARGLETAARSLQKDVRVTTVRSLFFSHVEDALRGPHELAERLEAPGALERLVEELRRELPAGTQVVLLPPVLWRKTRDLAEKLSSALGGIEVGEILSAAPSVPGLRLQESLDEALANARVERFEGEVRFDGSAFLVGDQRLTPKATVLATGKYIGGGIVREQGFREPVLDLPVFVGARRVSDEFIGDLLGADLPDAQPAFRAGVRTDSRLRPLGEDGLVIRDDLFAAGSVLGGYDPAADKTGLGVSILTGFLAGEFAAEKCGAGITSRSTQEPLPEGRNFL